MALEVCKRAVAYSSNKKFAAELRSSCLTAFKNAITVSTCLRNCSNSDGVVFSKSAISCFTWFLKYGNSIETKGCVSFKNSCDTEGEKPSHGHLLNEKEASKVKRFCFFAGATFSLSAAEDARRDLLLLVVALLRVLGPLSLLSLFLPMISPKTCVL